jgi:hypothetical protein
MEILERIATISAIYVAIDSSLETPTHPLLYFRCVIVNQRIRLR